MVMDKLGEATSSWTPPMYPASLNATVSSTAESTAESLRPLFSKLTGNYGIPMRTRFCTGKEEQCLRGTEECHLRGNLTQPPPHVWREDHQQRTVTLLFFTSFFFYIHHTLLGIKQEVKSAQSRLTFPKLRS